MADQIVRCSECGLEAKFDMRGDNVESFMVPEAEMKRKCKVANKPGMCPHLSEAITVAMQSRPA